MSTQSTPGIRDLSSKVGLATAGIGLVVFIGWLLDIELLKQGWPHLVTMKVNTALGLLLGGAALWFWSRAIAAPRPRQAFWRVLFLQAASLTTAIGALTLMEYGFGVNLGIDELIVPDLSSAIATSHPGRMAPNTALCLVLLGLALLLLWQQAWSIAQGLALGSLLIALIGFVGYLFNVPGFYQTPDFTAMAWHTSISIIGLSLGVLVTGPERGWMKTVCSPYIGGVTARRLLPLVILLPIVSEGMLLGAYRAHHISIETETMVASIVNILILGGTVGWNARHLNRVDYCRQAAERATQSAYELLETRVQERTAELADANAALDESRRRLSTLINTLPGIVFARQASAGWPIQSLSDGCLDITGYTQASLLESGTQTFQSLIVRDDVPQLMTTIGRAIAQQQPYQIEYRIHNHLGQERWLWEKGQVTYDATHQAHIEGFITDITPLKQTEALLHESRNYLRTIIDAEPECVKLVATDGTLLEINAAGLAIIEAEDEAAVVGQPISELIAPEYREAFQQLHQQVCAGHCRTLKFEIIGLKGKRRWLETHAVPIYNTITGTTVHLAVAQDITERRQVETELWQSRERYRSLVQVTAQVIWTTNADGHVTTTQDKWAAYTGQSFAAYQGQGWLHAIHPDDRETTRQQWQQALATQTLYETECRIQAATGDYRYFWVRAIPVFEPDGTVREWVGACTDISDRKQIVLELRQLNDQLEQRVQERTSELVAVNKELETFSYSVSHDLRTPLRAINGFSQVFLDNYGPGLDDKGKHYLERVQNGAQRMGELIDDLLQLARLTRHEIKLAQVNFSDMARAIAQELHEAEPERQVEWIITPNMTATGDQRLLRIVMENLLQNAWKFTATKPHARIEIRVQPASQPNNETVIYSVRDNGVGFEQTYADKLFGAFQRLHRADEFPGTGIGLATVQRIIHRHGGQVWAEGRLDEGTTISFTLQPARPSYPLHGIDLDINAIRNA